MIKLPKTFISRAGWFRVYLPQNWIVEEFEREIAFLNPKNGAGALQISAYRFPGVEEPNVKELLSEYLKERGVLIKRISIAVRKESSKTVAQAEFEQEARYWKVWMLKGRTVILFATYICPATELNELYLVERIIESVELE